MEKRILQKGTGRTPLSALIRLMDHWVDIIEIEEAKPEAERNQKVLQAALKEAGLAAERAAPFMHAKYQATAFKDVTERPTVMLMPEGCKDSKE